MNAEIHFMLQQLIEKIDAIQELLINAYDIKTVPATETRHVVMIERGETRNSASPKWTCLLDDNSRLWIIKHEDPYRDNTKLWQEHPNIWGTLSMMVNGDVYDCSGDPIKVQLTREGDFWKVAHIDRDPNRNWVFMRFTEDSGGLA